MRSHFNPPLAIHYVWHPSDEHEVTPILDVIHPFFSRQSDRPFSRSLNLPQFFYSSCNPNVVPKASPESRAQKDVIFLFCSKHTLGRTTWKDYFDTIGDDQSIHIVPVALDQTGLAHSSSGRLKNLNFLRAHTWNSSTKLLKAKVEIAHEVYRHGLVAVDPSTLGISSSIKVFLSHAKAGNTGRILAEDIYRYIDETNMSRFFDATEISPGFKFDQEIENHIKQSTLLVIGSDEYSSRYWCQREILTAKKNDCPILAIDCLENSEDRIFPASSNITCLHINPSDKTSEEDILRILGSTLLETIRHRHALKLLQYYQSQSWIDPAASISARPPELRQIIEVKKLGKNSIYYPEPPLYTEETDWIDYLEVSASTPLWSKEDSDKLEDTKIGVSISDPAFSSYESLHLHSGQLTRLAQDLARHLLARSSTLLYGGDLREDGFTQFILDEAVALKSRLNSDNVHVQNHLAWPLYVPETVIDWKAKYHEVIDTVEHEIPSDIVDEVDIYSFIAPNTPENCYIWSRCLTAMRTFSVEMSDARICVGGKLSGYSGSMPGVLEEILIAIETDKPIYLLGAFGGVVKEVCKTIADNKISEKLTEEWQRSMNSGYSELLELSKKNGYAVDYSRTKVLLGKTIADLATNAGLDEAEYSHLMNSPFNDESLHLVLKGLSNLAET